MKIFLLTLLASTMCCFAGTMAMLDNSFVTSSVTTNENGSFTYSYNISPYLFTKKDVSHFELGFCKDVEIFNVKSNIKFTEESDDDSYKFDNLEDGNNEKDLWFKFDSLSAPKMGDAMIKYGRNEYYAIVDLPICPNVPEVSTMPLALLGALLLLRRKR